MDFTLAKYEKLCKVMVDSDYALMGVYAYLEAQPDRCIVLRHDVDRKPQNALKMAVMESEHGIRSTYYFRTTKKVFLPDIIKEIAGLGHEIGYHYEVMDKARGDTRRAIEIFQRELEELRKIADIKTICMHGNPLAPWSNRDLWKEYDFRDFGIIGEPYLSIDYHEVLYLSDTGRSWDGKYSVKDVVNRVKSGRFKTTDDIINAIKAGSISKACLVVHPNRWNDDPGSWLMELIGQNIKNVGKAGIIFYREFTNRTKN